MAGSGDGSIVVGGWAMISTRINWAVTASRRFWLIASNSDESFGFVFVERVALTVAAQADHLAEMIEHDQMLAPQMIERLQQDGFLDVADDVGAPLRDFRRHVLVGAALDAVENLLVGDAFLFCPFVDRQVEANARA